MKFTPHPYQEEAIRMIEEQKECGLFLDMGLGKTVCTLTAIRDLMYETFEVGRVLVIATKRVALDTWTSEAEKWDHLQDLRVVRVLGTPMERKFALAQDADVYVINRENVTWLVDYYAHRKWAFDMIVIDELSSFKNPKSKRFRALRKVRSASDRVVGLTGTPAPNGYMDLWSEVYLLDRGKRLGKTLTAYRDAYFHPGRRNGPVIYEWILDSGAEKLIREKLSDLCISMRSEDYLTLPPLTVNDILIPLSKREMEVYRKMEKEKILEVGAGDEISAFQAATVAGKLLQLSNGAVYTDEGRAIRIHDRKLDALEEILEAANGKPVLVFYSYRHDLSRLREKFQKHEPRMIETQRDIRDWNEGKIPLLLAHPQSMGHGLNLQAGGHIIVWFGLPWSLEAYQQANARLYRQGQTEAVIIHRLICKGTVDEVVAARLEKKSASQDALLEYLKSR